MTDGIINYPTIKHALLMDIDHYESDERGIRFIPNWIQLVLCPIIIHYIIISYNYISLYPMISHQNPIHIPRSLVLMEIFQRTFLSMGFATLASPQHTRCSRAKGEALCSTSVWMGGRRVAAAWSAPDQRTDAADGRRERDL